MILRHKKLTLFGKMLFETMVLKPPFQKPNPMPNEACFLYVLEGTYNSVSEQERIRVNSDESVLMKCGNYLSEMVITEQSKQYQAVAVHFYPEVLHKVYQDKIPDFLKNAVPIETGMSKLKGDTLIKKYIESLLFYFENPLLADEEILILKLKEIILLLNKTKSASDIRSLLSNLFNPITYSFREIIEAHLYTLVTINELAVLTGKSLSSFKREFKKVYNVPPATYIRDKKLEKALELLGSTNLQATEIAYDCGFSDVSHFSKVFKQKHDVAPTIYKLNHFNKILD